MESFPNSMEVFKNQIKKGDIITAYQGLMDYFRSLRGYFEKTYPEFTVPANIYSGYLDMSYFSVIPSSLQSMKLKIAIVFVYKTFQFEVWLSGRNRNVQAEYAQAFKETGWIKYSLAENPLNTDYILAQVLVENPDFSDLEQLTIRIDDGTLNFIKDIQVYLSKN